MNMKNKLTMSLFSTIIDSTLHDMISESAYNDELKLVILTSENEKNTVVGDYMISKKIINIWGKDKHFYDILCNNEIIYENICLSSILIKLLMRLLNGITGSQNDRLMVLDSKYTAVLSDALFCKQKIIRSNNSSITKSIYQAKYDGCIVNLERIKDQIEQI